MGKSKNVHANNGDRSVFPTRCEIRRSKDESAYGRERPRLWLPREIARASRSRPSPAAIGAQRDHHWISSASRTVLSLVESGTKVQPIVVFVWYMGFIPTARARLAATQDPPPDCSLHRCIAGNTGPSAGSCGGELVLHDWWDGWILLRIMATTSRSDIGCLSCELGFRLILGRRPSDRSVWFLRRFVCLLLLAQIAPADVLLSLGGVGIFFALEPKAEPIHITLLRG